MKTLVRNGLAVPLIVLGLLLAGCERPPMETEQRGYRGLAIETITNPRIAGEQAAASAVPEPIPPVAAGGPRAADVYQNVQVLGDLNINEFNRLMAAITLWVSPEQGCNYCHVGESLADDGAYPKVVARRMIQMTRSLNANWGDHVGATGVTCYTCHRGNNIPENYWVLSPEAGSSMVGYTAGQNAPAHDAGLTSLPADPFGPYLTGEPKDIRVQSVEALPTENESNIKDTEHTYALMMNISTSLGVNCTHCHNSRSFMPWEASSPARVTAWHGLRMVPHLNAEYMTPLADVFPDHRKGPLGDVFKINCATCHAGQAKPLGGESMLPDYPNLGPAQEGATSAAAPAAATESATASGG